MLFLFTVILSFCFNASFVSSVAFPNRRVRGMSEALERAVERTKEWQSTDRDRRNKPLFTHSALRANANRPIRMVEIDVPRLNRLIKIVDRAWTLPKLGTEEPIGSNFQYKKTCASIYKARSNACEQTGFGIMCFNFCYEKGEKLAFKCEDASAPSFCKNNGNYDNFLSKYKKDAYRAKAYIHQQLTRCYSSAICDEALLNSTLLPKATQDNYEWRAFRKEQLQRKESRQRMFSRRTKYGGRRNDRKEMEEKSAEETATKSVPFWQRLMVRKKMEEKGEKNKAEDEKEGEEEEEEKRWSEKPYDRSKETNAKRTDDLEWDSSRLSQEENMFFSRTLHQLTPEKSDSLQTERSPQNDREKTPNIGLWRNFQPGKWFQSVHYMTNTG